MKLLFAVAGASLACAGVVGYVRYLEGRTLYYPTSPLEVTPADSGLPFEDVVFTSSDGIRLHGWFISAPGSARVLLFCHGNAGNIGDRLDSIWTFHRMGLNVFIFDYRGYGDSTGKPTEKGTYLDATAVWEYLTKEKKIAPGNIVIFGRSLGGSVGTWLAERVNPGALVVESTFASAADMGAKMFPFLPIRLLCRFKYDTVSTIGKVNCPVLVAHSRDDEMIPFEQGKRIFAAAKEPKLFVEMRGEHNSGGLDADQGYQKIFQEFLAGHLGRTKEGTGGT